MSSLRITGQAGRAAASHPGKVSTSTCMASAAFMGNAHGTRWKGNFRGTLSPFFSLAWDPSVSHASWGRPGGQDPPPLVKAWAKRRRQDGTPMQSQSSIQLNQLPLWKDAKLLAGKWRKAVPGCVAVIFEKLRKIPHNYSATLRAKMATWISMMQRLVHRPIKMTRKMYQNVTLLPALLPDWHLVETSRSWHRSQAPGSKNRDCTALQTLKEAWDHTQWSSDSRLAPNKYHASLHLTSKCWYVLIHVHLGPRLLLGWRAIRSEGVLQKKNLRNVNKSNLIKSTSI